jgi:methylmalonyl-CoA mutase C-terminal domain/subunit
VNDTKPIRVLIAKPGLDGHDVGAKIVCRALMDAGMEVIYTGLRQSPEAIARAARDEDVDVVGLSVLSGAHMPLTEGVLAALAAEGVEGKVLMVGGNIPAEDCPRLEALGVDVACPTGTTMDQVVEALRSRVGR